MTICTIQIEDEVNIKVSGLDVSLRRKLEKKFKFFQQHARHTPAYKLGRWDGCVGFFSVGGRTYLNLLDQILPEVIDAGYSVEVDDNRTQHQFSFPEITEDFHGTKVWPEGHTHAGQPITLRDYQIGAITEFTKNLQSIGCISTGSGKTIMTATMSALIEPFGRSVVIVPNKDLVKQTYDDYFNLGLDVGVYFGDKKELNKTHTICTWQSLNIIDKNFKEGISEMSLAEFSQGMVAVIVDECHGVKGEVLQKLLNGPFATVPIRWGLTGTIPKEDYEKMGLLTSIGPVVGNIAASDLQAQGVLSNCNIKIVQLADNVEYSSYQEELSYLTTDQKRMNYFATMIESISESGNTLVLVDRIKCGEMLKEAIAGSVFVSGSMKSKDRKDEYDEVALADNKVVIASYGVAAVGINIVRLHNIVLLEPGKSFIRVIQSIGRGLRKGFDKDSVEIWDITSNCKFSKRHLPVRKSYYTEAGYPFTVQKLKWK